ncbi:hypothetical protein [Nissabacter sp. SGAir0207]|uniref:hypothetical protein n=1 Tax=Nissabacter sp. SGAir0207 TaxID=2126321 RepID=UPI00351A871F
MTPQFCAIGGIVGTTSQVKLVYLLDCFALNFSSRHAGFLRRAFGFSLCGTLFSQRHQLKAVLKHHGHLVASPIGIMG